MSEAQHHEPPLEEKQRKAGELAAKVARLEEELEDARKDLRNACVAILHPSPYEDPSFTQN